MNGEEVDVVVLWELLHEDGGQFELADLAELALGDGGASAQEAVAAAIDADKVHFRNRKGRFEPRAARSVAESLRQARLAAEREVARGELIESVRAARAGGAFDFEAHAELLRPIVELAVLRDGAPKRAAAEQLVADLDGRGKGWLGAFNLLVDLGHFGEDENLLLLKHRVPTRFPAAVLDEAERLAQSDPASDPLREDLTDRLTVAIDDAETNEVDDALSVTRLDDDTWRVEVHIADPSAFFAIGSLVDGEAARRGATLYLPDRKVPMLPPVVAFDRASLQVDEVRPALTFRIDMKANAEVLDFGVVESVVSVDHGLTYGAADLAADETYSDDGALRDTLVTLRALADESRRRRRAAGAFEFQPFEVKTRVDERGEVRITPIDRAGHARRLVAEWMILTGHLAGRWAEIQGVPVIYRCQEPPDHPLDVPDDGLVDAATFYALVRSLRRASISTSPAGHAGLGVHPYMQVTSPLRRYTDLAAHRQLKAAARGQEPPLDTAALLERCAGAEAAADVLGRIERETNRYFQLKYLAAHRGEFFSACVLAERPRGRSAVQLEEVALQAVMLLPGTRSPGDVVTLQVQGARPREDVLSLREVRDDGSLGQPGGDPESSG